MGYYALLSALLGFICLLHDTSAQYPSGCTCPCAKQTAYLYAAGPLPLRSVFQANLPAPPFQVDVKYLCDASELTLLFCSGEVASFEEARNSANCYTAELSASATGQSQIRRAGEQACSQVLTGPSLLSSPNIHIKTSTENGNQYLAIFFSQNVYLLVHETSHNLDFSLLKKLYAFTANGTSCSIQFEFEIQTEQPADDGNEVGDTEPVDASSNERPSNGDSNIPTGNETTGGESNIPSDNKTADSESNTPSGDEPTDGDSNAPSSNEPTGGESNTLSGDEPTDGDSNAPSGDEPTDGGSYTPTGDVQPSDESNSPTDDQSDNGDLPVEEFQTEQPADDGNEVGDTEPVDASSNERPSNGDSNIPTGNETTGGESNIPSGDEPTDSESNTQSGDEPTGGESNTPGGDEPTGGESNTPGGDEPTGGEANTQSGDEPTDSESNTPSGDESTDGDSNAPSGNEPTDGGSYTPTGDVQPSDESNSPTDDQSDNGDLPVEEFQTEQPADDGNEVGDTEPVDASSNERPSNGNSNIPTGNETTGGESNIPSGDETTDSESNTPSGNETTGGESNTPSADESTDGESNTPSADESTDGESNTPTGDAQPGDESNSPTGDQSDNEFQTEQPADDGNEVGDTEPVDASSNERPSNGDSNIPTGNETTGGESNTPSGDEPTDSESNTQSGDETTDGESNTPSGDETTDGESNTPSGDEPTDGESNTPSGDEPTDGESNTPSGDEPTGGESNTPSGDESTDGDSNAPTGTESTGGESNTPTGDAITGDESNSPTDDQSDSGDLAVEDYPSLELQANDEHIPIYQADDTSDFNLNFISPDNQSIEGLVFFLLPSTSSSPGNGYVIRFFTGYLNFAAPGADAVNSEYIIGNISSGAHLQLVVEGNALYIRILQGQTYINLVSALPIERSLVQAICVGATRVFYLRYYCGLLTWISQPSVPELDDDTPKDYNRLVFETDGTGEDQFNENLKFNVRETSRYDFLVQAPRGAIVYLSADQSSSSAVYRLVIGDGNDGNTVSLYRASVTNPIAIADATDVLNQFRYVRFSITISRNPDTKVLTFILDMRSFHSSSARRLFTFTDTYSYEQSSLYLGFNNVNYGASGSYRVYWICYIFFIRSGSSLAQGYTQTIGANDRAIQVGPFLDSDRKLLIATNLQSDFAVEFLDSDKNVIVTISFGIDGNTRSVITQNGVELASQLRSLELSGDTHTYAYLWISFFNGVLRAGYQFESGFISSDNCTGLSNIRFARLGAGDGAPANAAYTIYYWRYFIEVNGELSGRFNDISYRCYSMEEDAWGFSATVRTELPECWGGYVLFRSSANPIAEIELRPSSATIRDRPNGIELQKISGTFFSPSASTSFALVSRGETSSLFTSDGSSVHSFDEKTQSYCLAVSPCRDLSVSGISQGYAFSPRHGFELSHFQDTPPFLQGNIGVNLTQLASPVLLQFSTVDKKTYSISFDIGTGGENGTISLYRFNLLVKSDSVDGLHLDGQQVNVRIGDQKVEVALDGSDPVFVYQDPAQPANADAKCLIQNAQVTYIIPSGGSGTTGGGGANF